MKFLQRSELASIQPKANRRSSTCGQKIVLFFAFHSPTPPPHPRFHCQPLEMVVKPRSLLKSQTTEKATDRLHKGQWGSGSRPRPQDPFRWAFSPILSKPSVFPRVDSTLAFPYPITNTQIQLTRKMCSNGDDELEYFPLTQKSAVAKEIWYVAVTL